MRRYPYIYVYTIIDGFKWYYTGRAGEDYISKDRTEAFGYASPDGANHRCNILSRGRYNFYVEVITLV